MPGGMGGMGGMGGFGGGMGRGGMGRGSMSGEMPEPVSLLKSKDFGQWLMVQAANVKITVEKSSGIIVNVSGGGCPDVPWLAGMLTGKSIREAEEPKVNGQSLCSYALQKAFAP